ncbi:MAG: type II toxin-antitoxin system Phd/YefM family antitoxin [Chloroflexi bacterium]|nr:type II toxin-antitoxin system Phd/YefM family antitoxin [Chloroflexota bacterium]
MPKTITANQAQTHLSDIIRQIVENGDPIIVEQAGIPQVAVISLADLERLCEPTTLGHNGKTFDSPNTTKSNLWEEFERELQDLSIE